MEVKDEDEGDGEVRGVEAGQLHSLMQAFRKMPANTILGLIWNWEQAILDRSGFLIPSTHSNEYVLRSNQLFLIVLFSNDRLRAITGQLKSIY